MFILKNFKLISAGGHSRWYRKRMWNRINQHVIGKKIQENDGSLSRQHRCSIKVEYREMV